MHGEFLAVEDGNDLTVFREIRLSSEKGFFGRVEGFRETDGGRLIDISNAKERFVLKHTDEGLLRSVPGKGWQPVDVEMAHLHPIKTTENKLADIPKEDLRLPVGGLDMQAIEGKSFSKSSPSEERWWFRYGEPPESGFSRNRITGDLEAGVSVYSTPVATSLIDTNRPLYAVRGRAIALGSDDEPVIKITGDVIKFDLDGKSYVSHFEMGDKNSKAWESPIVRISRELEAMSKNGHG